MLQNIRDNAQGVIAKIIIGFICITFALFGVDALFGISSSGKPVAEVNDREIDERDLNRALETRKRRLIAEMGEDVDPSVLEDPALRTQVLEELVQREVLLQKARDLGMEFSARQVEEMLVNTPEFQVDGTFNQGVFERAVRAQGMSPAMFRDFLREEMMLSQLQFGLEQSGFVTKAELEVAVQLQGQTRDLAWLTISAQEQGASLEFVEDDLRAYYEANPEQFSLPERVGVEFVVIDRAQLSETLEISDESLQQAYEAEVSALQAGEERLAKHILFEVPEGAAEEKVRERAASVRADIMDGLTFEEAVAKYSEDVGSRENGGDLGWIARGGFFGEKFEEALFGQQVGLVSEPVRSGFGYHLLLVTEVRAEEPPAFEEMRPALEARARREQVLQLYAEKIEELSALAFESGDLQEPSTALELKIWRTGLFDQAGEIVAEADLEWVASKKFRDVAFSDEVRIEGVNSDLFEPRDGVAVVLRVVERKPGEPQPFAEVQEKIEAALRRERGAEMAAKLGAELLEKLRAGESAGGLAALHQLKWENRSEATRGHQDVPPRVLGRAFALPRPEAEGKSMDSVQLSNGDTVLVVVSGVHAGKSVEKFTEREVQYIRSYHAQARGATQFSAIRSLLKNEAEIRKF